MAEAIHCPSCSTRYRLLPERLSPAHRRARCFTCHHVFPIGDVVQRLLAPAEPAPVEPPGPVVPEEAPSLTLVDLEGAEAEILDTTLVGVPLDLPEAKPAQEPAPEPEESTLSGYTSAREAIEKLLGETPAPREARALRPAPASSPMDVEATLSALEQTLGGVTPPPAEAAPSTATMRFTRDEVMAAMAEAAAPVEPTVQIRADDLAPIVPEVPLDSAASAPTLATGPLPLPSSDPELLRLKTTDSLYPGLTMAQLVQWVEEGRVLEGHLVARQFSENWIEAYKVPGLRPVFERLRRERAAAQAALMETPPPPLETAPMKRGLFGGLFGGKN